MPLSALTQALVNGPSDRPAKRFLSKQDCTWLEDPDDERYGCFHAEQWKAVKLIVSRIGIKDACRQFLLLTARQAAKTTTKRLAAIECATRIPNSKVLYVSFDLATGQELIYEPVQRKLEEMGWKYTATQSGPTGLRIKLENGSIIQCRSADDLRSVGRLRGRGWHLILGDEVQDMLDILKKLFDEALGPTTFRYSGVTVLAFTPPDVQVGWLWEQFNSGRWERLGWPMTNNPFLPPGAADAWMQSRGLTVDHPIARREVLGLWEPNTEKQVFEFEFIRNTWAPRAAPNEIARLPDDLPADKWLYGVGGDIGWHHHSSVTLLAWNYRDPRKWIYELLTVGGPEWTVDRWFDELMRLRIGIGRKPFRSFVIDQAGSGGLNVVHTLEARFQQMGLPVTLTYKPASVAASVGLVNDELRLGRLKIRNDSPLIDEFAQTIWKEGSNRLEIDKAKFDPHGLDGLRYGVWGSTSFRSKAPPKPLTMDEEREQREAARERAAVSGEF